MVQDLKSVFMECRFNVYDIGLESILSSCVSSYMLLVDLAGVSSGFDRNGI